MKSKFDANDFDRIYATYFEDILAGNLVAADPSGWAHTETEAALPSIAMPSAPDLAHYLIDNRKLIQARKEPLVALLSAWDRTPYSYDEVTLTPSISAASLAVLLLLQEEGIRTIYFETPAYYASLDQAEAVGMRARKVPTYSADGFQWDPTTLKSDSGSPIAVWITQPRYSLGADQSAEQVGALLSRVGQGGFVVVDETADQLWPTALSVVPGGNANCRLIKIRGFMKPLGLNALRMACQSARNRDPGSACKRDPSLRLSR